jgi:hypothetical protein
MQNDGSGELTMRTMPSSPRHAPRLALAFACAVFLPLAQARPAASALAPGEYATEGGWGVLTLRTEANQRLLFELETVGPNGHTCSLDGEIRNGRTTVGDTPGPVACVVRFVASATGTGIDVSTNDADSCHSFCGARASFVGRYLRALPGCDSLSRGATGAEFRRLYEGGAYRDAQQQASRLLERCAPLMTRNEYAQWLNDLAAAQYRLGQHDACVRTLQPLADDAAASNQALMDRLPPTDYENYLPLVETTRSHLRWCKDGQGRP